MASSSADKSQQTYLFLSQVYVPDPASVGQHVADAAAEMARRGYRVVTLTASRGYDDPSVKYPLRETINGVEVRRIPLSSFGKRSIALRLLGGCLFMLQAIVRGLFVRRLSCIVVSTSPPMCSLAAMIIGFVRRVPIKYWVMDLNPDQMIQLGKIKEQSLPARLFNAFNKAILKRAADVVVLDRFMSQRVLAKRDVQDKITILPPWPHEDQLQRIEHANNPFRVTHGLAGKFVIMYSGNHSIASPLTTILQAAVRLKSEPRLLFMFIGGGLGKKEVEQVIRDDAPGNIVSLPYQPLSEIKYSLSAADVHLVSLGEELVGIIHPCKIYGAMAVGRPILLLGPAPSHASEIIEHDRLGWHVKHGDVEGMVAAIQRMLATPEGELNAMGSRAQQAIESRLSKRTLCGAFCDVLERAPGQAHVAARAPEPAGQSLS